MYVGLDGVTYGGDGRGNVRFVRSTCAVCGAPVSAWFTGTYAYKSGEPVYHCDCPKCGTETRART